MANVADGRQTIKFWTLLAGMILLVSVAILLIDMSIKNAILEESNALRLVIEEQRNGRGKESADNKRGNSNGSGTPNVLGEYDPGLEIGDVLPGDIPKASPRARRRNPRPTQDNS